MVIEHLEYHTGTLAKLTISPSRSRKNRMTVRLVSKKGLFKLICRSIPRMVAPGFSSRRKENYHEWTIDISGEKIKNILSILENAVVPVFPEFLMGDDGTDYTLELSIGHKVKFNWWSVPPKGYEPLDQFASQLIKYSKADEQPDFHD